MCDRSLASTGTRLSSRAPHRSNAGSQGSQTSKHPGTASPNLPSDQTCRRQVGALAARRLHSASAGRAVRSRGCPGSVACCGDSAPTCSGNRLAPARGLHNPPPLRSPALRMLPPGFPSPAVAAVHRATNSGKRRPAPGRAADALRRPFTKGSESGNPACLELHFQPSTGEMR
jgi:hypothetical protein